ncbi:MAG: hypothetical protein J6X18_12480 [Bacteroidales bacterium]|nr:hypothetical protein [Bacteroidales bacterium]
MAKITKASDDVINVVQHVIDSMGMTLYVRFFALNITGQKQLVKVAKASPTTEYFSQKPDSILVYVNEEIYGMLEPKQREMLIANALYGVNYDDEKDKLNVNQPEIGLTVAGYQQYGIELVNAAEAVQLALQQLKEKKEEEKQAKNKKKHD